MVETTGSSSFAKVSAQCSLALPRQPLRHAWAAAQLDRARQGGGHDSGHGERPCSHLCHHCLTRDCFRPATALRRLDCSRSFVPTGATVEMLQAARLREDRAPGSHSAGLGWGRHGQSRWPWLRPGATQNEQDICWARGFSSTWCSPSGQLGAGIPPHEAEETKAASAKPNRIQICSRVCSHVGKEKNELQTSWSRLRPHTWARRAGQQDVRQSREPRSRKGRQI